jgi:pyridoxamine 5'-phosphate oxidase
MMQDGSMQNEPHFDLAALRRNYSQASLTEEDVTPDPISQFHLWFGEAVRARVVEPNAMTLATASPDGRPSARTVLLKGFDDQGFMFYTNYESRKGVELDANPRAALLFTWLDLERQVRIEGTVARVSHDESLAYFQSRPKGSQIGAWASPQSRVIRSREVLEKRLEDVQNRYRETDHLPLPAHWGGYRITPELVEFWQGRENRLHDRIQYRLHDGAWIIERLAP